MPSEFRDIVFTKDEVVAALGAYDRLQSEQAIDCDLSDLSVEGASGFEVTLRVNEPDGDREISVTQDMLRAALVRFCIENNIMVPKRAKKTTFMGKTTATLRIKID